jgi:hypothetical protein
MAGELIISIEVELGWNRNGTAQISAGRKVETESLNRLLSTCDSFDVPVSFDVVGHLFLKSCPGDHDGPHESGWFNIDPGGSVETEPLFYAPDLIDQIQSASVEHEICTHSYSHARLGEASQATLDCELERVAMVHEDAGLEGPTSLVPPWHSTPPLSVLPDHGIDTVRRPDKTAEISGIGLFRSHPPLGPPTRESGVVVTPCAPQPSLTAPFMPQGQTPPHPVYEHIPLRLRQWFHRRYLKQGLDDAIDNDGHVHYWSHLFNMANDEQLSPIESFVRYAAERRDDGELTIRRMCDLE